MGVPAFITLDELRLKLLFVQQPAPTDSDVENFAISSDFGYNGIRNLVALIHEPNPLEHSYSAMDVVAIHLQPLDYCIDDANHTWENEETNRKHILTFKNSRKCKHNAMPYVYLISNE